MNLRRFIEIPNFNLSISGKSFSTVNSNLTITVTEPLSFDDKVKEFWSTYGPIISLVTAGFVGGISTYSSDITLSSFQYMLNSNFIYIDRKS